MSWQQYVDSNLVGTGKVTKGAIHGHNGALWATSKGFNVGTQEINDLFQAYTDPSGVRANGLHIGSVKHICIKADDRSVYGKKGTGGVVCVKTKQAILIGAYEDPIQPGECAKVVEALADYLISVNY